MCFGKDFLKYTMIWKRVFLHIFSLLLHLQCFSSLLPPRAYGDSDDESDSASSGNTTGAMVNGSLVFFYQCGSAVSNCRGSRSYDQTRNYKIIPFTILSGCLLLAPRN